MQRITEFPWRATGNQAIIDAEEQSAAGRNYRFAAFGVFGGLAGLLSLTRVCSRVMCARSSD